MKTGANLLYCPWTKQFWDQVNILSNLLYEILVPRRYPSEPTKSLLIKINNLLINTCFDPHLSVLTNWKFINSAHSQPVPCLTRPAYIIQLVPKIL